MKFFKLLRCINILDVFIVLVCFAIVYAAHIFSAPQQALAESGTRVQFTLEFGNRHEGFYRQIAPGTIVLESSLGQPIGTVVYAYSLPFLQDVQDEANNIIRRTPVEGREFTYVVVETLANVSDFETEVNQFRIAVNRDVYIRSRDFAGRAFIVNVEFME